MTPPRTVSRPRAATLALTALSAAATTATAQTATARRQPRPAVAAAPGANPYTTRRAARTADSVLALLTLEEKIGQLTMAPAAWNQTGPYALAGGDSAVRAGGIGSFLNFWGADATRRMQRIAVTETRRHVPLLFSMDVIHGWRTVFPIPLAEAGTFDTAAVERAARVGAIEGSAQGLHWTFAPMVDIARDARWGRLVEGSGEDPFLGSAMAAARVYGFQGRPTAGASDALPATNTMVATVKHFAAYGAAEAGRDYNTAELSERTLWDVYLPPYAAAVRAGAGTVMASFNDIGGTPAHASRWLLQDVLRDTWRFTGLVVSDWAGIEQLIPHGVAGTRAEAARRAAIAGVDVDMSDNVYDRDLAAEVRAGRVPMAAVDSAAHRVLELKAGLGLFDDPYRFSDATRERTAILTAANRAVARQVAQEAVTLLKNAAGPNGTPTLPLAKSLRRIAVIGPYAADTQAVLGSWRGAGRWEDAVSVLAGLREAVPNATVTHAPGVPKVTPGTPAGIDSAVQLARASDAVVLVVGEPDSLSGEATSRAVLDLPGNQLALVQAVVRAAAGRVPVVAVLVNGHPLALPWVADSVPAVVESWQLGVEHGHAVADVLFGDVNPAGRLPISIPYTAGQAPIYYAHKNTGRPMEPQNHYTSKYLDVPVTPLYPFGHGLSYTTFRYAAPRLSAAALRAGDSVTVTVDVTNAGARAGDEVVQLYLRDDVASVARPVRELKGFARVALAPGETRAVRFVVGPEAMAFHGLDLRRVVEPGTFTVWVGGSSATDNAAHFTVTGDTLVLAPAPSRYR